MFATAVRGQVDVLNEALKMKAEINGQTRFVSYTILCFIVIKNSSLISKL